MPLPPSKVAPSTAYARPLANVSPARGLAKSERTFMREIHVFFARSAGDSFTSSFFGMRYALAFQ